MDKKQIKRVPLEVLKLNGIIKKGSEVEATPTELHRKGRATKWVNTREFRVDQWPPWTKVLPEMKTLFGPSSLKVTEDGRIREDSDLLAIQVLHELTKQYFKGGAIDQFPANKGPVAVIKAFSHYVRLHPRWLKEDGRADFRAVSAVRWLMRRLSPGNQNTIPLEAIPEALAGYVLHVQDCVKTGKLHFLPKPSWQDIFNNQDRHCGSWTSAVLLKHVPSNDPWAFLRAVKAPLLGVPAAAEMPEGSEMEAVQASAPKQIMQPWEMTPEDLIADIRKTYKEREAFARETYERTHKKGSFDAFPEPQRVLLAVGPDASRRLMKAEEEIRDRPMGAGAGEGGRGPDSGAQGGGAGTLPADQRRDPQKGATAVA